MRPEPVDRPRRVRPASRSALAIASARALLAALGGGCIVLAGCVGGEPPVPSGGADANGDAEAVAMGDTGGPDYLESGAGKPEAGPDASEASALDSGSDAGPDATSDSATVSVPDATLDSGTGSRPDATPDSAMGSVPDATSDSGLGSVPDAAPEASSCPPPSGTGALGTLGCACASAGQLACNGNAQPVTLICSGGVWTLNQTCSSGFLCDSRTGATKGTCQPVDPACSAASPSQTVCSTATTAVTCGPDLVSDTPAATCTNQACVAGACTGMCSPQATQCTSATQVETCNGSGQWGAATACPYVCSGTVGALGGNCGGVCVPATTQCSGNGYETCSTLGQWGSAVACTASQSCSGGSCSEIPSCAPGGSGLTGCEAYKKAPPGSGDSCCTSMEVTGGMYDRTYTNSGSGSTGGADPASVGGFRLDKYEVTVGRFRQFVGAWNGGAGFTPTPGSGKHTHLNGGNGLAATAGGYEPGWGPADDSKIAPTDANLGCGGTSYSTWTTSAGTNEYLPINCVTWYEAYAFCVWDGGFLPSEAEWEYAAAGGSQELEYPWGSTDPGTTNQYAIYDCYFNGTGAATCTGTTNIAEVGTALGAGLWGQVDLSGNVDEWTMDWYASSYVDPCTDCANLTAATYKVIRGGGFSDPVSNVLPTARADTSPLGRDLGVGFRCARTP